MKQYRITTADLNQSSDDDCYLSPDDPIHQLKGVAQLGGLGSEEALAQYRSLNLPKVKGTDKGQIARELKLEPGTDAWFKHWFGGAR
jgi:hypothetical protein